MWYLLHPRLTGAKQLWLLAGAAALLVCLCITLVGGWFQPALWHRLYRLAGIGAEVPGAVRTDCRAKVHFIDVGQGDAVLLEQGGQFALIDAGPRAAQEDLLDYLDRAGVDRLSLLVMTHPDGDHIGGMAAVLETIPTELMWLPRLALPQTGKDPTLCRILDTADRQAVRWENPHTGAAAPLGEGVITLMSDGVPGKSVNDWSLCTRFAVDHAAFLNTGDAEWPGEACLLQEPHSLAACLFKAGHHGSASSSAEAFLAAVQPEITVISCGWENAFGHPALQVSQRLERCGTQVYRTDRQGSVVVCLEADGTQTVYTEFAA